MLRARLAGKDGKKVEVLMALKHHPPPTCNECDAPDARIITLFTRNTYCGRFCLAEGQTKYCRMILRAQAEGIDNGAA